MPPWTCGAKDAASDPRGPRASSISPAHVLTAPGHSSRDRSSGGGRPRPLPSPAVSGVAASPGKSPNPFPHAGARAPAPRGALEIAPRWAAQVCATCTRRFLIVSFVTSREARKGTSPRSIAPSGSSPLQRGQRHLFSATSQTTAPRPDTIFAHTRCPDSCPWPGRMNSLNFILLPKRVRGALERAQKGGVRARPSMAQASLLPGASGRSPSLVMRDGGGEAAEMAPPRDSAGACGMEAAGAGHAEVIGTQEAPWRPPERRGAPCTRLPTRALAPSEPDAEPSRRARPVQSPPRRWQVPRGRGEERTAAGTYLSAGRPRGCAREHGPGGGADCSPGAAPPTRGPGTSASATPAPGPWPPSLRAPAAPRPAPRNQPGAPWIKA